MLGIHTVHTGLNRDSISKFGNMMQFEVLTMILSALYWKRFQGPIKLYCDPTFYELIKSLRLDSLWDEIDYITLSQSNPLVNYDVFWSYSKMYVNSLQTEPFVSLDVDLFQDQPYDYTTHDVVFSHIEKINRSLDNPSNLSRTVYYPDMQIWDIFSHHTKRLNELEFNDEAINVAILAVNKPSMYKEFMEYVDSFVFNNKFNPRDFSTHGIDRVLQTIHSASPITFAEQRIMSAFIQTKGLSKKSIVNLLYDGSKQEWIGDVSTLNTVGITHLWGWKHTYRLPGYEEQRLALTNDLLIRLENDFPKSYKEYVFDGLLDHFLK